MIIEIPDILRDKLAKFSPTELDSLRRLLTSHEYLKLLSIAECMKPSANCSGAGSGARDAFSSERANARLGEIRGWELHAAALLAAINPLPERRVTQEDYQPVEIPAQPETKTK